MAYLMTDMAAGSNAARTMQQNMYGAQYDQQNIAEAAKQQQLKTQQDQATVERTRLSNMISESGFITTESSKAKLQAVMQTPEWKTADDADRVRMAGVAQISAGDTETGVKNISAATLLDSKKIATDQKRLDMEAQTLGNAGAVVDALPLEKVDGFFKEMETNQPEAFKALVGRVGPDTWAKMSPTEKKEAVKGLTLSGKGQNAIQLKQIEVQKAQIAADAAIRRAEITANASILRKAMGGADHEMKDWNMFQVRNQALENSGKKALSVLDKKVDEAEAEMSKHEQGAIAGFFGYVANDVSKAADVYTKAVAERDDFKREQIRKQLDMTASAPQFPGKKEIMENLNVELALYPEPPPKPKGDKIVSGTVTPPAAEAKPAVPSTRQSTDGNKEKKGASKAETEFNTAWAKLKPGESLVGPDGKTYIKK